MCLACDLLLEGKLGHFAILYLLPCYQNFKEVSEEAQEEGEYEDETGLV